MGTVFSLSFSGATQTETITFQVEGPGGQTFTGSPHNPAPDGTVSTYYATTQGDLPGSYTVVATGSLGSSARAAFVVTTGNTSRLRGDDGHSGLELA